MNVLSRQTLLSDLIDRTAVITSNTHPFLRLSEGQLNFKVGAGIWSIAEIFGHLNITNTKYIHSILERIKTAPDVIPEMYQNGWLGDWVYEKLMPRADGSVFRINAPKFFHAEIKGQHQHAHEMLNQFIEQLHVIHDILIHSATKDLRRIRVPFYLTGALRFRLGDTLRFLIAHNERHLLQAHRMLEQLPLSQKG